MRLIMEHWWTEFCPDGMYHNKLATGVRKEDNPLKWALLGILQTLFRRLKNYTNICIQRNSTQILLFNIRGKNWAIHYWIQMFIAFFWFTNLWLKKKMKDFLTYRFWIFHGCQLMSNFLLKWIKNYDYFRCNADDFARNAKLFGYFKDQDLKRLRTE